MDDFMIIKYLLSGHKPFANRGALMWRIGAPSPTTPPQFLDARTCAAAGTIDVLTDQWPVMFVRIMITNDHRDSIDLCK